MSDPKEYTFVNFTQLSVNRESPRHNDLGDMQALKASLLAQGIVEPIAVRKFDESRFMIVAGRGYRRFIALQQLAKEHYDQLFPELFGRIPVRIIRGGATPEDALAMDALAMLAIDEQKPLPLEAKALALRSILQNGQSLVQASARTGIPIAQLSDILAACPANNGYPAILQRANRYKEPPAPPDVKLANLVAGLSHCSLAVQTRAGAVLEHIFQYLHGKISAAEALTKLGRDE